MTASEHVLILLSLVISLAFAHILSGIARLIQAGNVRWSWLHAVWVLFVLLLLVDFWISVWQLRLEENWNILMVLFWMTMAILNYLISALVVPDHVPDDGIDLRDFHETNRKRYLGLFGFIMLFALAANLMLEGFASANFIVLVFIAFVAAAAFTRSMTVQWIAVIGTAVLYVIYFSMFMANFWSVQNSKPSKSCTTCSW